MGRFGTLRAARAAAVVGLAVYLSGGLPGMPGGGAASVFAAESAAAAKSITAGKPTYRPRNHAAWETKGRIVGRIRNNPGCEVQVLDATSKKTVKSCVVKQEGTTYELQWLEPGTYILVVKATGYETLDVHDLVVKAGNDLVVDLEF